MDPSFATMNEAIEHWLDQWERCLNLWLECGAATPSPLAVETLRGWSAKNEAAGWATTAALTHVLLDSDAAPAAKADALLDLMSWYQATRRIYHARDPDNCR